ncbi:MAG: hypothetical protein JJ908_12490 [Rhizobiales bacterium]|nr:hypothetical protein [Hyphomicrobiales bacterium]MBO6699644.1 hypothetical protein [Hyphomicrobiales bacterium]MBO6737182.1 hypothetical protein [Hyphomicrobiales bacterium]MBO6911744.1 hypothetical protein [Hyphomicrobiales bacterium]MBO6954681.1 hypothetical protein [Hyphomicrobiales bacterium]
MDDLISNAFDHLAHSLRILLEADLRANRGGLLMLDRDEAIGNIEGGYAAVLNAFHRLHDAASKSDTSPNFDWYGNAATAAMLVLRNARHHNHCYGIRTLYNIQANLGRPGALESYVLVDFEPAEEGASTFDLYLSAQDLQNLLALPQQTTRIRPRVRVSIEGLLGLERFQTYTEDYGLSADKAFFNAVPLIVAAASVVSKSLHQLIRPRSLEGETYLSLFSTMPDQVVLIHDVNCGPFALP